MTNAKKNKFQKKSIKNGQSEIFNLHQLPNQFQEVETSLEIQEVLLAPIESIAQGIDEMQPGMKLLIAARLDKKCHFFMSPAEVQKVRNFDFSGFNYVFKL